MSKLARDHRNADLAKIHLAKKALAMTDEDYRAMLWTQGRVHTAADLDHVARQRVLEHLKACGWPPRLTPQQWRIQKLWHELGQAGALEDQSDKALLKFIKGHSGADALQFVAPHDAATIIEALKGWLKRVTRK